MTGSIFAALAAKRDDTCLCNMFYL